MDPYSTSSGEPACRRVAVQRCLALSLVALALLFWFRLELQIAYTGFWTSNESVLLLLVKTTARFGGEGWPLLLATVAGLLAIRWAGPRVGFALHFAILLAMCLMAAANVHISSLFGQPLSPGLLKFAGAEAPAAIISYISASDIVRTIVTLALLAAAPLLFRLRPVARILARRWFGWAAAAVLAAAALTWFAPTGAQPRQWNALAWFVRTGLFSPSYEGSGPMLFDKELPFARVVSQEPPVTTPEKIRKAGVRNVVLVVLESVGGVYLSGQDMDRLMPEVTALSASSAMFRSAYAHAPSSGWARSTILGGRYMPVEVVDRIEGKPRLPVRSLTGILAGKGYDTAGFFASDWAAGDFDRYLEDRKLDMVHDGHTMPCNGTERSDRNLLDYGKAPDACVFRVAGEWISQRKSPFLAIVWTDQTHYPYRQTGGGAKRGGAVPTTDAEVLKARYFANIRLADRLIGKLVRDLDVIGKLDDTLLVIVGDHGEAFNQHGVMVHGVDTYEETMRVPLVFVNRRLFSGAVRYDVVGHIDIMPTILDALGIAGDPQAEGVSLLSPEIRQRTYMVSPWGGYFGVRSNEAKYVYNFATSNLEAEPFEWKGRMVRTPQAVPPRDEEIIAGLWNWLAAVNRKYEGAAGTGPDTRGGGPGRR